MDTEQRLPYHDNADRFRYVGSRLGIHQECHQHHDQEWAIGYCISFSSGRKRANGWWIFDLSNMFFNADDADLVFGSRYTHYMFQFSFATAATTIVSGAVAERMQLKGYMIFAVLNTLIYCCPARWAWNSSGFLSRMGFFDFAGGCIVHVSGGASALVAAWMLGPRFGRFANGFNDEISTSPLTALTGLFMLWWAWLGFNCGSSYGITKDRWKIAAKVGVVTMNGSIGGGIMGLISSYVFNKGTFSIDYIMTSVLGGLVAVTAGCSVISPTEALLIGCIGAAISLLTIHLLEHAGIDDPVQASPVHFMAGSWGTIAIGLFGKNKFGLLGKNNGLFHGGGLYLLAVQTLGLLTTAVWSIVLTAVIFIGLKFLKIMRMTSKDELLGADWVEHNVRSVTFAQRIETALLSMNLGSEAVDSMIQKMVNDLAKVNGDRPHRRASVVQHPMFFAQQSAARSSINLRRRSSVHPVISEEEETRVKNAFEGIQDIEHLDQRQLSMLAHAIDLPPEV